MYVGARVAVAGVQGMGFAPSWWSSPILRGPPVALPYSALRPLREPGERESRHLSAAAAA